ncbi:MAG: hypothetical protein IPM78_11875 [Moraxellaceae bacterium]|nr:hypothetical protein [Moraxellaceae bacterium]
MNEKSSSLKSLIAIAPVQQPCEENSLKQPLAEEAQSVVFVGNNWDGHGQRI